MTVPAWRTHGAAAGTRDAHSGGRLVTVLPGGLLRSAARSPGLAAMLTPEAAS